MSTITVTRPGMPDRNGLPPWRPYVYRGLGVDTLTPHLDTGKLFTPVGPSQCHCDGSMRAYRKHLADGEQPCRASRDEVNLYHRERARLKRAAS